ncbi:hypothetical protein HNP81_000914 [Peribacillus huizhouensis]|uniref:Uncharacterized protein n=1 Tax=Peribacillus huizhouensis TaxID=1501239 RepID=A0ABR6CL21_9BACI|nr:hypothetical protein [Peribacillus huizhouensis]
MHLFSPHDRNDADKGVKELGLKSSQKRFTKYPCIIEETRQNKKQSELFKNRVQA